MIYPRSGRSRPRPRQLPRPLPEGVWPRVVATIIFVAGVLLGGFIGVGIWRFIAESHDWRDKLHDLRRINGEIEDLIDDILNVTVPTNCTLFFNGTQPNEYPDSLFRIFDGSDPTAKFRFNNTLIPTGTTQLLTSQNVSGTVLLLEDLEGLGTTFFDNLFAVQSVADNTSEVMLDLSSITAGETSLLTIPDKSGIIALLADIPAFPSVFLDSNWTIIDDIDNTKAMMLNCSQISSGTTRIMTVQDRDCTIAYLSDITNGTGPPFSDAEFQVYSDSDSSSAIQLDLSGVSTATTITLTVQDRSGVIAYLSDIVQVVEVLVNTSRAFPDIAFEGVSSLSGLGALTHVEITLCGGGGGSRGYIGDGVPTSGGGSGSLIKDFFILTPSSKFDTFNCTIGAGGPGGAGNVAAGNNTIVTGSSSSGFFLELIGYGGGPGEDNANAGQAGGSGGGSGGRPLNQSVAGIAGDLGGVSGSLGSTGTGSPPDCLGELGQFKAPWWGGLGGNGKRPVCNYFGNDLVGWQGGYRWAYNSDKNGGPSLLGAGGADGYTEAPGYCSGGPGLETGTVSPDGGDGVVLIRYYAR